MPPARRNTQGDPDPQPSAAPPQDIASLISSLVQNGSIPLSALQSLITSGTPPAAPVPAKTPPSTRSFTRPGRGTGGVLEEKKKTSKDITASTVKRKTLVDLDVELQPPSEPAVGTSTGRATKRQKSSKVNQLSCILSVTTDETVPRFRCNKSERKQPRKVPHNPTTLPNHSQALYVLLRIMFPCALLTTPWSLTRRFTLPLPPLLYAQTRRNVARPGNCPSSPVRPDHSSTRDTLN